jgi:hypothetical protein
MTTSLASSSRRWGLVLTLSAVVFTVSVVRGSGDGAASAQETAAPAAPAGSQAGVNFARDREAIFDAFYKTGLDTSKPYAVANLTIRKDNMTLLLKQGTVFLMKPIAGEVTGLAFIGDGAASMTPPNRTERYMLRKYSGADTLNEPFTEAVFRFSDGTDRLILVSANPDSAGGTQADAAGRIFADRNSWLDGTRDFHLEMQWLENRISGLKGQDFFMADLHTAKHDWLLYSYNPQEISENSLTTFSTMGVGRRYPVTWIDWHKQSDYGAGGYYLLLPERDGPRVIKTRHYDMTLNLPTTKTVEWDARMRIEPLMNDLRCLRFDLSNNADYDKRWYEDFRPVHATSVKDEADAPLTFMHRKDQLLVLLLKPARAGTPLTLQIKGAADVIYQVTAESYGLLQNPWYPGYGYRGGRYTFHWTARVPKTFLITGSGRIVREFEDKESNQRGIETLCEVPADFPWIIFGRFQKAEDTYVGEESKRSVPLTIHAFPYMTFTITDHEILDYYGYDSPVTIELTAPPKKIGGMFEEGKEVLKLYEKIYGPYPYDQLHIAQMAPFLGFGQAPQGFVQLTGEAFMSQAKLESDFFHGFLAHEFAHQWWGHQVDGASPDDEWLSEGFAEYASGIFVKEYQGPKRFQRTLDEWRKRARMSDQEAPIAAANTLIGPPGGFRHRNSLLYYKAPYVLHMLRVQLDDEKYVKVMRSLQETYRNQDISSEMLLREINKVTGEDYTFFFDQWFYDVGIPTFRYSWRSEKQPDGKFLITVHVGQDDKANFKKVQMPVHIHFKDKTIPQYRMVVQAEQDIKIMSPLEPKDVTLDDDRVLLAEIVKAK